MRRRSAPLALWPPRGLLVVGVHRVLGWSRTVVVTPTIPVAMSRTPTTGIRGWGPLTALGRTVLLLKKAQEEKYQEPVQHQTLNARINRNKIKNYSLENGCE